MMASQEIPSQLVAKYAAPVPRYTSYPTAPHFHAGVNNGVYRGWLAELPAGSRLSLYLHVPFCDRLCWFCGCHTKQTARYEPVARYLQSLVRELETVAGLLNGRGVVTSLHFGGGSPSLLAPEDLEALGVRLRRLFRFSDTAEISLELDPKDMDAARLDALATLGMTRASLGVQDFDPAVQAAINRPQTFEETRAVVEGVRARGAASVNLDVLYGLPLQTLDTIGRTIDQVLELAPDRIALFGYAHVPWIKRHQTMIPEDQLPDLDARFAQSQAAAARIEAAGYQRIGIDHFARPDDGMAQTARNGTLKRNFQGYTVDEADALIGFGASAIGRLPQGYVQNTVATAQYERGVDENGVSVARGFALSDEDRARAHVIEQLMCGLSFSYADLQAQFGAAAAPVIHDARRIATADWDGFVCSDAAGFRVDEAGRPFIRSVAAAFDAYLGQGRGRHSVAV
jgi:oxygen-independent coproporphyrinogen-3 oxidase